MAGKTHEFMREKYISFFIGLKLSRIHSILLGGGQNMYNRVEVFEGCKDLFPTWYKSGEGFF